MATPNAARPAVAAGGAWAILAVAHTANDAFANLLPAWLPIIQARFDLTETVLAVFVATVSISANMLQAPFGAISDRLGRRVTAALGVIACSALMSLVGVAPSAWILFALLAVGGLGSAAFHPAAGSLVRSSDPARAPFRMSLFMAAGPIGSAVAPVALLFVIAQYGIGFTPLLMIPGVILGALIFLLTPPQPRDSRPNRPKIFDMALVRGPVGALCAIGILRSMAYVTFINAAPLYMVHAHGVARDSVLIGWTLAVFNGAAAFGGIAASALAGRLGRQAVISGSMILALPCLYGVFLTSPGTVPFYVLVALGGFFTNAAIPLLIVTAQDLAPHAVATASGMLMGLTWGSAGVLYIGIGRLQETIGIPQAMSIGYAFMIPSILLTWLLYRKLNAQ